MHERIRKLRRAGGVEFFSSIFCPSKSSLYGKERGQGVFHHKFMGGGEE
jgi:hypothetical protein